MPTNNLSLMNFYDNSLKDVLNASDTIIYLNSVPTPTEGYLVINPDSPTKKEIIYYTSKNDGAGTVTCPSAILGRGIGGTTAQTHEIGEPVKMNVTAEYWQFVQNGTNPIGAVVSYAGATAPGGWMLCDGTSLLRTEYPALFTAIGTAWGAADSTHFNIPDLRGVFLRGRDGGAAKDPDRASRTAIKTGGNTGDNVGSYQDEAFKAHTHTEQRPELGGLTPATGDYFPSYGEGEDTVNTSSTGGNETRPKNANINYLIRVV